jgi:predicted PurR-regulated permease PerM
MAALGVFLGLIWLLGDVLAPFVTGITVAYLFNPIIDRVVQYLKLPRALATITVLVGVFIILIGAIGIIIPLIQAQLAQLIAATPATIDRLQEEYMPMITDLYERYGGQNLQDIQSLAKDQASAILGWIGRAMRRLWSGGDTILSTVTFMIITPVVAFYLGRDWHQFIDKIDNLLPRQHVDTIRDLARQADATLAGFVRGQASVCVVLGGMYGLALSLIGLNFGLVIGFLAGVLSFIPYVGSTIGFIASMAIALFQFDGLVMPAVVAGIFFAGQAIEGNILTPKLVGEKVGLHAVWVIFALFAGGHLFGFVGVLLAVPVAAVIGVLIRFGLNQYQQSMYYHANQSNDTRDHPSA